MHVVHKRRTKRMSVFLESMGVNNNPARCAHLLLRVALQVARRHVEPKHVPSDVFCPVGCFRAGAHLPDHNTELELVVNLFKWAGGCQCERQCALSVRRDDGVRKLVRL